jgi:hypothetical protein
MKRYLSVILTMAFLGSLSAFAQGWATYKSPDYGFSMLIPEGTTTVTKEWGGGWGGFQGTHDGVTVLGVAKLGEQALPADIEKFGIQVTGIPAENWTEVDKGSGDGWNWYKTVKATKGTELVYGGYGTGPKGSYLLLIITTKSDFTEYRAEYEKWYNSIRLN